MRLSLIIVHLFIFVNYFNPVFSQEPRFEIGLNGGPSVAFIYGNKVPDGSFDPILAGRAGLYFQYHFSNHYSFKTGVFYERKGANFTLDSWNLRTDYIYHFDYLTLPLLVEAEYGKNIRFYFNLGPYFSYLLNLKYIGEKIKSGAGNWLQISENSPQNKNKIDFGVCLEFGMKLLVSKKYSITIGVGDHLGLYNTKKQPIYSNSIGQDVNSNTTSKNNAIYCAIGCTYRFGIN